MKVMKLFLLFVLVSSTIGFSQNKISIGVNGGAVVPSGTMGDLYETGFGGGLSLNYKVFPHLQLFFGVDYTSHKFKNDVFDEFCDFFKIPKPSIDATISVIPVMVGAKYYLLNSGFNPYASIKVGLHTLSLKSASIKVGNEVVELVKDESVTKFGWGLGVGFLAPISGKVNIDVNIGVNGNQGEFSKNFNYKETGSSYKTEDKSTGLFFSFMAGLNIEL